MNEPMYKISISKKLRAYREKNNISQCALGKMLGVSAQAVCKWEKGVCYPDITILPILARLVGCSIDSFFDE